MPIRTPRPQRKLHAPTTRPRARPALSVDHHLRLARRLTPRDRWLIRMLHEHHVLTTDQITTLAFPSPRAARHRLLELYQWNVLDRFQPLVGAGSAPMHYVLGGAGAGVLAAEEGITTRALGYRRDDVLAIAHRHTLAHTVAVNDVFAELIHHHSTRCGAPASTGPQVRVVAWWSETRCTRYVGDLARPDAYGRITVQAPALPGPGMSGPGRARSFEWFFELDFGTEPLARLAAKLDGYAQLAAATHPTPVLIWLPSPRREAHARDALAQALRRLDHPDLVPLATTTPTSTNNKAPIEPNGRDALGWLPIDLGRHHPAHPRPDRSADAREGTRDRTTTRCALPDLAALWPTPTAESHATELHATGSNDVPSHADLSALDRASSRIVHLPAPDPVPPDPATFNSATRSAVHSSVHSAVPRAMRGAAGPSAAESGRRGRSPT